MTIFATGFPQTLQRFSMTVSMLKTHSQHFVEIFGRLSKPMLNFSMSAKKRTYLVKYGGQNLYNSITNLKIPRHFANFPCSMTFPRLFHNHFHCLTFRGFPLSVGTLCKNSVFRKKKEKNFIPTLSLVVDNVFQEEVIVGEDRGRAQLGERLLHPVQVGRKGLLTRQVLLQSVGRDVSQGQQKSMKSDYLPFLP